MSIPLDKIRRVFEAHRKEIWREWGSSHGSPFEDMDSNIVMDESPGANYIVGWLVGVAEVTGWSLRNPKKGGRA